MTTEQLDKLKLLLMSSGWRDVMKPVIEGRMKVVRDLSFMLPGERPKPYQDLDDHTATSFLKGENKALEWVLHAFENTVVVEEQERRREELARQANGEAVGANPA